MSMSAVAVYLRTVREGRGISRAKIAKIAKTSETTVYRIERGDQEPSAPLLMALVDAVGGSIEHVKQLILDKNATANHAQELAKRWLDPRSRAALERRITALPDDQIEQALDVVRQMLRGQNQGE